MSDALCNVLAVSGYCVGGRCRHHWIVLVLPGSSKFKGHGVLQEACASGEQRLIFNSVTYSKCNPYHRQ